MNKKGSAILLLIFEVLAVLLVMGTGVAYAEKLGSSKTVEKIRVADDYVVMLNYFSGLSGDAIAQYPSDLSSYTLLLTSTSFTIGLKDDSEVKQVVRELHLPSGYIASGLVEQKAHVCLEKKKKNFILRECSSSEVLVQ